MGDCFIHFYQEKIKKSWKIAFVSAMIIGLLTHLYGFTNILPVADSLYNGYSSQNMVASGRWFLSVACGISAYHNLPYFIGILSLVLIGITAAVLTELFQMEKPCLIIAASGLLVTFPSIWTTFGYIFTADGYMIAMLLAAISVLLTRMEYINRKNWVRLVFSGIAICLSLGIYQAYISFAFVLAVSYFILELLENRHTKKEYLCWIGAQIVIYLSAMAAYYLIWKLCLQVQNVAVTTYQGMDQVGSMENYELMTAIRRILREFVLFLFELFMLTKSASKWAILNILCALCLAAGLVTAMKKSGCFRNWFNTVLILLCLISIPFGCFAMILASPNTVQYQPLMLQSMSVLFILTAVLFARWVKISWCNLVLVLLCAVIYNNSLMANTYYTLLHQCYERTYAVATEVSTRIHMKDDGSIQKIAILGSLDSYAMQSFFEDPELREIAACRTVLPRTLPLEQFLYAYTDFELAYYRSNDLPYPAVDFSQMEIPAPHDWECRFPLLSLEEKRQLTDSAEVQAMPVWPHADSVAVFGDTIVVKLS